MKSTLLKTVLRGSLVVVAGVLITLSSCKKDTVTKPAPTLSLTSASTSNAPGQQVTTSVTVNAPEGGKTLTITVNGAADAALPNVEIAGATSKTVDINYTIPANAVVGSTILISFQASDNKGQLSMNENFTITVTAVPAKTIVDVPAGNITTDTHWTSDKIYRLNGFVRIGTDNHSGPGVAPTITATATLTIDAGTVIYGKTGTPGGCLIVQRGSKIIAIGTATNPIVFTSEKAVGTKKAGDWGGFVLCGKAANNTKGSTSTGTDGIEELEGGYGAFHGGGASPDNADNSGTIQYVRVEFAGYPINPNQEINGITFGSVGSGTTFDHVQVTYANDDSFEWFGGSVNCKNIVAYKGIDDDFDTDNGFSGHVQFGLGIRDAGIADQSGSNGFESDNDANGSSNTPVTSCEFSNMTIIGGKATSGTTINLQFQNGAQLRRNGQQKIINTFFTGYPNGIYIDNALGNPGTIANATNGSLVLSNNIFAGVENWGGNGYGTASTADERTSVTGLPFAVPQTAGSSTLGDYNHPNNPRGRVIAGGVGAFTNGAFAYTTGELQISGTSPVLWVSANNTMLKRWNDSGISANIFEPLNGAPTLIPTASSPLLSGVAFTGFNGFTDSFFDKTVTYRGAFGSTDWTATGWINWNPQITDYSH